MAGFSSCLAQIPTTVFSTDQVLGPYVFVFYVAFLVAFLFTPIMRMVAMTYGIIDRPDQIRKMHSMPVAYLGGVAVFLGWLCGLAVANYLNLHRIEPGWPTRSPIIKFSIPMGALIIVVLGLWDDILGVRPKAKILAQVAAALLLLWDGVGVDSMRPLLLPVMTRLGLFAGPVAPQWGEFLIGGCSAIFVVCAVVGCCNATNLMDGLDGLCGGVTAIIAAGFVFVAVHLAMVGGGINTNWDALRIIVALSLLGAVLGFIPYNFNPASIFMGDTGSMLLGYACATMIIMMAQERAKWFLAAMVMFALPILDTALAFARRWINGRPLFSADKQHFHHQLVARGYSVKQTVLISYGLAIFFALLGVVMVFVRTRYTVALYLVIFGSVIVAAFKMGMVHERPKTAPAGGLGKEASNASSTITSATVMDVGADSARVNIKPETTGV
jgi:UDP-GlcNAc:undecaprenyl-phosphate GlcNAc-1-phosphate transferase